MIVNAECNGSRKLVTMSERNYMNDILRHVSRQGSGITAQCTPPCYSRQWL